MASHSRKTDRIRVKESYFITETKVRTRSHKVPESLSVLENNVTWQLCSLDSMVLQTIVKNEFLGELHFSF